MDASTVSLKGTVKLSSLADREPVLTRSSSYDSNPADVGPNLKRPPLGISILVILAMPASGRCHDLSLEATP
jgi:hypothetical protein